MPTMEKPLSTLIEELPPHDQDMIRNFVEFLIMKRRAGKKLRQDWAGALRDFRDEYTALELQKKALDWRSEA